MTGYLLLALYMVGGLVHFLGLLTDGKSVGNADIIALADDLAAFRFRAELAAAVAAMISFVAVWPVIFIYGQYRQHISRAF